MKVIVSRIAKVREVAVIEVEATTPDEARAAVAELYDSGDIYDHNWNEEAFEDSSEYAIESIDDVKLDEPEDIDRINYDIRNTEENDQ